MNNVAPTACYPPSASSCCSTTCNSSSSSQGCVRPEVTSILGLPFQSSGAFVTILGFFFSFSFFIFIIFLYFFFLLFFFINLFVSGNNFGSGYYDTAVQFNDTSCLIHEKTEDMIVCWLSGDIFGEATNTYAVKRNHFVYSKYISHFPPEFDDESYWYHWNVHFRQYKLWCSCRLRIKHLLRRRMRSKYAISPPVFYFFQLCFLVRLHPPPNFTIIYLFFCY